MRSIDVKRKAGTDQGVVDSNLYEQITALDEQSRLPVYPIAKLAAHQQNVPHLAISIFIFRARKLLLQRRAITKYHSGGLWANTVCSHPRWQENASDCAHRRLEEELGFRARLTPFGLIDYQARVGDLYENERVHCFRGEFSPNCTLSRINPHEVADVEWLSLPAIVERIDAHPERFTEWFKIYMMQHRAMIDALLG